jgi:putative acetyltransferase
MNLAGEIEIRRYRSRDAAACLGLFRDTIHRINIRDYSQQQVDAWAPQIIDLETWSQRFDKKLSYVAVDQRLLVGFADMNLAGHLDRLYVSADYQRRGIARRLVDGLIQDAIDRHCKRITTEASITAKPFFESMGFEVLQQQSVECLGIALTNFKMQRLLG